MVDSLMRQVALVSESKRTKPRDLARVAAALQKQAARDLSQFWALKATVDSFPTLEDVPVGYWPIVIMDNIHYDAAGIHLDQNNEPFALVTSSKSVDEWSLTASHEMIEMLVDPWGSRMIAGDSPKPDQGRAQFLVEPCDPSEAATFAYTVNGVLVSDFYTVRFFDPVAATGVRYSFTGAIKKPRQVLKGGYLSWLDVTSNQWWQETWFSGNAPAFQNLGALDGSKGSFRSQIDRLTWQHTAKAIALGRQGSKVAGLPSNSTEGAGIERALMLRRHISTLTGKPAARSTRRRVVFVPPIPPGGGRAKAPARNAVREARAVSDT